MKNPHPIRWLALVATGLSAVAAEKPPVRIVAFGDSTTAERPTIRQVYAQRLPMLLKEMGIAAEVINSGLGGSHTGHLADNAHHKRQHALDRFQSAVRTHQPEVVIIQFGINDAWVDKGGESGPSRIPVESYASNLTFMVRTLKTDKCNVILMTPNALGQGVEDWRKQRLAQYAQAARDIAAHEQVKLLDIWRLFEGFADKPGQNIDELLLDGMHPNDRGHLLVAQQLAAAVHALLSVHGEAEGSPADRPASQNGLSLSLFVQLIEF